MTTRARIWLRPPSSIHRGWKTNVTIGDLLDGYNAGAAPDADGVVAVAKGIHDRLTAFKEHGRDGWAFSTDTGLDDVIDEFHTIYALPGQLADAEGEFNAVLDALYQWGDEQRVLIR
jgi:hypothetical protein